MSEKVSKSFETPFPLLPMPSPSEILARLKSSNLKTVQSAPISKEKSLEKQPIIKKSIVSSARTEEKHEVPLKEAMEENRVINYRRRPTVNLRGQTKSSERNELKDTQRWKEYVDDSKLIAPEKNGDQRKLLASGKPLVSQPKVSTTEVVAKPRELKVGKLIGSEKGPQLRQRAEPKEMHEEIFEEKEEVEELKKPEEKPRKRGRPPKNKNIVFNQEEIVQSPNLSNEKENSKEQKNLEVPRRESQRLKSKTPVKYLENQEEKPAEEATEKKSGKLDESLKKERFASGINSEEIKSGKNDQVYIICKECLRKKVKVPARYVENNAELDEEDYMGKVYQSKSNKTFFKDLEKKPELSYQIEFEENFEASKKPGKTGLKNKNKSMVKSMEIEEPVVQSKEKQEIKDDTFGQGIKEKKPLEKRSHLDLPSQSESEVIRKSITPPIRTNSNKAAGFEERINLSPRKKSYSRIYEERILKDLKQPEGDIGKKSKTPPIRALKFPDSNKKEDVEGLIEKLPSLPKKSQSPQKSFAEQEKEKENLIESEEDKDEQESIKNLGKTSDNEFNTEEMDECDCPSDEEEDLLKKHLDSSIEDQNRKTRSKTHVLSLEKSKSKTPLQSLEKPKGKTPVQSLEKVKLQSKNEVEVRENSIQMNLTQKKQEDKEEFIENESEDGFVSQFLEKESKSKSPTRKSFEIFQSKVESAMNKDQIEKPSEEKKNKSLSQIKKTDQNLEEEDEDVKLNEGQESFDFLEKEDQLEVKKTSLKKIQSPVKRSLNKSKTPLKREDEQIDLLKEKEVSKDERNKEDEEEKSNINEEDKEELFARQKVDKKKSKTPVRSPEAIVVHVDKLPEEKLEKDFIIVEDIVHHSQLQEPMEIEKEEPSEKKEVIVSESAIKHEEKKAVDPKDSEKHENNKNEEEQEKLVEAMNGDKNQKEQDPKEKVEENNNGDDDKDGIASNKKEEEKLKASQIPASQDSAYRPKEYRTRSKIWIDKPLNIDNSLRFENSLPAESTTIKKEKTIRKPATTQPTKKKVSFETEKKEANFEKDQDSSNRPKKIPEEMAKLMRKKIPPAIENTERKIGKKPISENIMKSLGKKPINENVMRNVRESCKKGLENIKKDIPKKKGKK